MDTVSRRKFLTSMSVATIAVAVPGSGYAAGLGLATYVEAATTHGRIRGLRQQGVNLFKGIPYAGSVAGVRRFKRPAPLAPWPGVRDAVQLGAPAMQPPHQTRGKNEPPPSEECLFLNVWTPANDGKKRPVMFYNHGGGFSAGSGGAVDQDGSNLARLFDVVVVQTNHRLGILGFLYLEELAGPEYAGSGNAGMLDIVDGLAWVHQNIAGFGGDPDNVLIFGESGGGEKTSCLYAMPAAAPYFNKASIESGPGVRMMPREAAAAVTATVLRELNIAPKDWRQLLQVPVADLLRLQVKMPELPAQANATKEGGLVGFVPESFSPVVDGAALPSHPFDPTAPAISRAKPLMTGWNEDEYTFFAMAFNDTAPLTTDFAGLQTTLASRFGSNAKKIIDTYRRTRPTASAADLWVAIMSVNTMGLGTIALAERKAGQHAAPVYVYNFGYKSEAKIPGTAYAYGTPHALDITFKFNNEVRGNPAGFLSGNRPERFGVSHTMAELWATFARTGKPAATNVPEWPAYNLADRPTLRIDTTCEVLHDRYAEELAMWRSLGFL